MSPSSRGRKLYHITHVDNLAAIAEEGALVCDREMIERGGPARSIGMSSIKRRRVEELDVDCNPGTKVGDYVPLYFCPRSVMLFVIHRANDPELAYRDGQGPILHLVADLESTLAWAEGSGVRWAFSRSNAGAYYAEFGSRREDLATLDWDAIDARDFRASEVKERKQAELLVHGRFPFGLVERIGARSTAVARRAEAALAGKPHRPVVEVRRDWYY